jgi:hypothetical protein
LIEQFGISVCDLVDKLEAQMLGVYSRVEVSHVNVLHLDAVREQLESKAMQDGRKKEANPRVITNPLDVVRSKLTPQQLNIVQYSSRRPLAVIAGAGKFNYHPPDPPPSSNLTHRRIRKDTDHCCSMCPLDKFLQAEPLEHFGLGIHSKGCGGNAHSHF